MLVLLLAAPSSRETMRVFVLQEGIDNADLVHDSSSPRNRNRLHPSASHLTGVGAQGQRQERFWTRWCWR